MSTDLHDFWYATLQVNSNPLENYLLSYVNVHPLPGEVMLTSMKSHLARDSVTLLQTEMPEFISPTLSPPILPDLSPVDYTATSL